MMIMNLRRHLRQLAVVGALLAAGAALAITAARGRHA